MPIDFNQLRDFIEAIAKTDITDLAIKEGDFELTLQKNTSQGNVATTYTITPPPSVTPTVTEVAKVVETPPPPEIEKPSSGKKACANVPPTPSNG